MLLLRTHKSDPAVMLIGKFALTNQCDFSRDVSTGSKDEGQEQERNVPSALWRRWASSTQGPKQILRLLDWAMGLSFQAPANYGGLQSFTAKSNSLQIERQTISKQWESTHFLMCFPLCWLNRNWVPAQANRVKASPIATNKIVLWHPIQSALPEMVQCK